MTITRRIITATALLLAVAAASACQPVAEPYQGPDDAPTVGVVGDSLIFQAENGTDDGTASRDDRLTNRLVADGWRASVAGAVGAATFDLDPALDTFEGPPDALVVALGTNDLGGDEPALTPDEALAYVDAALADYDGCVSFVGVIESDAWNLIDNGVHRYNIGLSLRADVPLVAWEPEPGWVPDGDVHHTPEGQEAYREAVAYAASMCAEVL